MEKRIRATMEEFGMPGWIIENLIKDKKVDCLAGKFRIEGEKIIHTNREGKEKEI